MTRRLTGWVLLCVTVLTLVSLWRAMPTRGFSPAVVGQDGASVSGVVWTLAGAPAVGATVRRQTSTRSVTTAKDGSFALDGLLDGQLVTVTAWLDGYYVGWVSVTPTISGISITLRPYPSYDNEDYVWRSALDPEEDPRFKCSHCMVAYPEWAAGAHAQAAVNPRFFSMYNGTVVTPSSSLAITTAPDEPAAGLQEGQVVSPGYKLDFPGTAGNCATCHAPGAATRKQGAFTADMNDLRTSAEREGVLCDFCHHVGGVYLNPATGLPYANMPGVLSYRLMRTSDSDVLFLGSLDDVTRRVSNLPLERQSQFCAPCHQFSFWGTPIYQSFQEWTESPYPALGIECQTCHMPRETVPYFVYPEIAGSLTRDPSTLASHLDLGVKDVEFMRQAVAMTVTAQVSDTQVWADVTITNVFAGHDVPTDYPGRNMILVVTATDSAGAVLPLVSGPTVPEWGGMGSAANDYAGRPGKGFAKVLRDALTGEWPVVSYWKQAFIQSDNRIAAGETDVSRYVFDVSTGVEGVRVEATLWFRRLYITQARAKGWDTPDIEMGRGEVRVE